jgi:hypothetical protein
VVGAKEKCVRKKTVAGIEKISPAHILKFAYLL